MPLLEVASASQPTGSVLRHSRRRRIQQDRSVSSLCERCEHGLRRDDDGSSLPLCLY